jgi:hypothetical protein
MVAVAKAAEEIFQSLEGLDASEADDFSGETAELSQQTNELAQSMGEQPPENSAPIQADLQALATEIAEAGGVSDAETEGLSDAEDFEAGLREMDSAELYEHAREMNQHIREAFADVQAAKIAEAREMSFDEAREQIAPPEGNYPEAPEGMADSSSVGSPEQLKQFSDQLREAAENAERMVMQGNSLLQQTQAFHQRQTQGLSLTQQAQGPQRSLRTVNQAIHPRGSTAWNLGENQISDRENQEDGGQNLAHGSHSLGAGERINWNRVAPEVLPSRRLTSGTNKRGWMFIDTWYVIGPWETHGGHGFDKVLPPETVIDFDATYDGKGGRDLRWRFIQNHSPRITPPDERSNSTYFFYTEIYSDTAREARLAIGTDDSANLWVNGKLVWEEPRLLSPWRVDEGWLKVNLHQGDNTFLVRIMNGPAVCRFSLMMFPLDTSADGDGGA